MKKKKIFQLTFSILFSTLLVVSLVYASWTAPTQDPPGGNVEAPINVSDTAQSKIGNFGLGGGAGQPLYWLKNIGGTLYFSSTNPAGDRIVIGQDGNVGIGTASSGAKLDVRGTVQVGADAKHGYDVIFYGARVYDSEMFWNAPNASLAIGESNVTASGDYSLAVGSHGTTASGFDSMAVGQNVTASNHYSFAQGFNSTASGFWSLAMGNNAVANDFNSYAIGNRVTASGNPSMALGNYITANGSYSFGIGLDNTARTITQANTMAIMGGNVGIGTTTPAAALNVVAGSTSTIPALITGAASDQTTDLFQVAKNPGATPAFVVTSAGNVGIRTTTPAYTLDVAGTIRATKSLTAGINIETLSADKTLTPGTDAMYQYLDPNGTTRTITLDTSNASAGDRFIIRHNGAYNDTRYLEVKQGAATLDYIYAGAIKEFIFDGTNWISAENGVGENDNKKNNVAIGYYAIGYDFGTAVGRSAYGYN
ncbi:hypothetical protein J7J81_02860, partial [bacterium]|nr:hypothetical protein [bacterium]